MREVYSELLRLEEAGARGALAVVIEASGSTPQVVGAKMVVREDGGTVGTVGGGRFEKEVIEVARQVIASGQATILAFDLTKDLGMCCGGAMKAYVEPVRPPERLVLFGGGHVATATAPLARNVGFAVRVVDPRTEWANADRFPGCEVVNDDYPDYLDDAVWAPGDHIFVTTHDHALDRLIVDRVLSGPQSWTGMIGSHRKSAKLREYLATRGHAAEAVARLSAPVGLEIGAETPEEIAVSVVAQLVQHRRLATPDSQ